MDGCAAAAWIEGKDAVACPAGTLVSDLLGSVQTVAILAVLLC